FLFNMETITAYEHRDDLTDIAAGTPGVDGVVFGRVDFSGSMGLGRDGIEGPEVTERVLAVSKLCKEKGLDFVVGGAVSIDALDNLKSFRESYLTRFETRKVIFGGHALDGGEIHGGLLNAVHFELLWLLNKRDYYGTIHREDAKRIEMLESRWKLLNGDK
ncbi:MAG: aldolase/citrate lyase family protein, partial [Cellulomonas sp.]|nr:aldolase/citrate lyase family protein [Cellulomonas sp.]